jgi:hypothetical protein
VGTSRYEQRSRAGPCAAPRGAPAPPAAGGVGSGRAVRLTGLAGVDGTGLAGVDGPLPAPASAPPREPTRPNADARPRPLGMDRRRTGRRSACGTGGAATLPAPARPPPAAPVLDEALRRLGPPQLGPSGAGSPPGRRSALRWTPPRAVARRLPLALAPSVVPLSVPLPLPLWVDRPLLTQSGVPQVHGGLDSAACTSP